MRPPMVKPVPVLRLPARGHGAGQSFSLLTLQKNSATGGDLTLGSFPVRFTQSAFSIRNSRNGHASVPFWLAPPIQTPLNPLC